MTAVPEMPAVGVTTQVTLVESEACHFCHDARAVLEEMAAAYPLSIRAVNVRDDEGTALVRAHRASMSPLVLVDGAFFSHGRLPRRKLARLLQERYGDQSVDLPGSPPGRRHG